MSTVILGCDRNGVNDSGCQDTVAKILKKAGHTVEKLAIAPNPFAQYSYSSKAKGKIGVYLMADSLVSVADLAFGGTMFKYAYFGIRGDVGRTRMDSWSDFNNNPIGRDADCTSICNKIAGKTYKQMNEMSSVKAKCQITFGKTPTELGNNIVKAMGGESSSTSTEASNVGTIRDAIREVQSGWDGDVECFVRGETFVVRKIPLPSSSDLTIVEGRDVFLNSLRITDFNPSSENHLTVSWKNNKYTVKDESLISRFGKITAEVEATDCSSDKEAREFAKREWLKLKRENGHKIECEVRGDIKWQHANWVRVYLPTFGYDDYMYISKVSHDDEMGDWTTRLVLVDYPPSLGRPEDYEKDENSDDDEEDENED